MIWCLMMPLTLSIVFKGVEFRLALIYWIATSIFLITILLEYNRQTSILSLVTTIIFSFIIFYDYHWQSLNMFQLICEKQNTIEQNEETYVENQTKLMRAMIGNVAHDLKTVIFLLFPAIRSFLYFCLL